MAIRVIRTEEDPVLRKISRPVKEVTPKIVALIGAAGRNPETYRCNLYRRRPDRIDQSGDSGNFRRADR